MDTASVDKQINDYLPILSKRQKKAVLMVVKTFAEELENTEYNEEFKKELDSRFDEYKNGGKLISEANVNRRINRAISNRKKK